MATNQRKRLNAPHSECSEFRSHFCASQRGELIGMEIHVQSVLLPFFQDAFGPLHGVGVLFAEGVEWRGRARIVRICLSIRCQVRLFASTRSPSGSSLRWSSRWPLPPCSPRGPSGRRGDSSRCREALLSSLAGSREGVSVHHLSPSHIHSCTPPASCRGAAWSSDAFSRSRGALLPS